MVVVGLGLGACGTQSGTGTATGPQTVSSLTSGTRTPSTANTGPGTGTGTAATATTTTATAMTVTHTVVGTTPAGQTATQTSEQVVTQPAGPDGIALESGGLLAPTPTSTTITGQTIDGVQCDRLAQMAYTAFAHIQVYVDGQSRPLPGGIGLVTPTASAVTGTTTTYSSSLCSYWVRTRAANGVIEVDAPTPMTLTLGNLFAIWGEPLSSRQVAGARGRVTAIVDGRRWRADPREIPLREHTVIELAVGAPIPRFAPVDWSATQL